MKYFNKIYKSKGGVSGEAPFSRFDSEPRRSQNHDGETSFRMQDMKSGGLERRANDGELKMMAESGDTTKSEGQDARLDHDKLNNQVEMNENAEDIPNEVNFKFIMTLVAFSMTFIGSQLLPVLFAALIYYIAADLNAGTSTAWLFSAQLVASGAAAPFVGSFSDLYGKKVSALLGVALSILGMIVCGASKTAAGFIAGQALAGIAVTIQELTAIAAVAEIVPIAKRGLYVAMIISPFLIFAPASFYGQLIAESNWRWNTLFIALWNALTLIMLAIFYNPRPQPGKFNGGMLSTIRSMDLFGGFLSITGICLFLIGLNWGGTAYPWRSAQVISTLILGLLLCIGFGIWEKWGTSHPLFPSKMIRAPRAFWLIMLIIFTAAANYVAILLFWPVQATAVYGADRYHLGIYTLPYGLCILGGAIISALLLSVFAKHVQWVMLGFCVMQTVGTASMTALSPTSISTAWGPIIVALLGAGGVLVPNQIIVTAITADSYIATATALSLCVRTIGQVVGYTLFYNRLVHTVTSRAFDVMLPVAVETGILDPPLIERIVLGVTGEPWSEFARGVPQVDTEAKFRAFEKGLVELWAGSFPIIYYISIAFGAVACVACVLIGDLRRFMNQHVAVRM